MPARRTSTRAARLPQSQSLQSIQRFTRASKPGTASSTVLDGKDGPVKPLPVSASTSCLTSSPSKKRKLNSIPSSHDASEEAVEDTPSKTVKFSSLSVTTPRSTGSRSLARTHSRKRLCSETSHDPVDETPAHPAAFDDFVALHSCFLRALGYHFAHKGTTAPADVKEILPSTEKLWKKRKVLVKDLQRIIQIWDDDNSAADASTKLRFRIANYGLGKVCLERVSAPSGPFNENEVHARFVQLLEMKWRERVDVKGDGVDFIESLALAPIHDSLTPFNALRKGQQRLQDLKGGVIKVKTAILKARSGEAGDGEPTVRDPTADRRKGLLERIRKKEQLQSELGPPPTKEQLLQRSAAQRAEDVARVLALLRPPHVLRNGGAMAMQRKPYKWEMLIQTVQDSLRNFTPADEIAACLEILGRKDVAADWIEIVSIGKLRSVILMSGFDVSPKDIGVRVSKMEF
ncbi:hypothetical protein BGW36DRAFT_377850 [Talaromyces proteolyticus]|uniref:DNA replication factor Cdt1 C-terminal domain-containing protein n=1 Tax=Talaromyces proteolyticus TaxID=1131652 RepID=A0AAD4Q0D7_9EURO|nr:uncharacterized protein BGW36DRAFT_377850 [Talaromyces proteolyticus]KAH8697053.1 hypothetical protein BGW36DRAFT_377850 [Talaromyces proteolyticus]